MREDSSIGAQFEKFDFRELPIGVYITSLDGDLIESNEILRNILGMPLDEHPKVNIRNYYADPANRDVLVQQIIENTESDKGVEMEVLHLKVNNRDVFVEDYCKALLNKDGKVVGFAGCVVDVTNEVNARKNEKELQDLVEELRFDIGRILHSNTTILLMVKQTLDAVIDALRPKPDWDMSLPSSEEVETLLDENTSLLANTINRFVNSADEERRLKALPAIKWQKLTDFEKHLRNFKEFIPTPELYSVTMRKLANEIGEIHSAIVSGVLPRELVREIQTAAWQLEKLTTLVEVLETRVAVIQMDHTIHSLRELITSDIKTSSTRVKTDVKRLIDDSIKLLAEYARSMKIDIVYKDTRNAPVFINERDMGRALSNLLHNAIKYSWHRDPERTKPAWITIRTIVEKNEVRIEFENWGVPIKREEIEQGKVFDLGYRGELSKDRGRLGTGIGLTDARRVAEAHGGRLEVQSYPSVRGLYDEKGEHYYSQPFITIVSMILPLAGNT